MCASCYSEDEEEGTDAYVVESSKQLTKSQSNVEEDEIKLNISHESPDEAQTTIEESDELSNEDKDKFVTCDDNDVDNVFKNSPIDEQNDFDDLAIYNNNNDSIGVSDEHGEDGDITLPPVNMMMDVLEHMLTEVSAAPTVSSSSSSISEPDRLDDGGNRF